MKNDDDIFLGEIRKMMRYQQEPPEISYLRDDINKIDREEYEQDNWLEKNTTKNHETEKGQLYHNEFYLYEVEFKRSKALCEKTAICAEDFEVGDYVKVECDRNHDLGVVCSIHVMSSEATPFFGENGRENFRKIIGRATSAEKRIFLTKIRDEERALHICHELVARKRLPITVLDANFQLDRTKLTFLYMSNKRVDFRDLVRTLFSLYKTRIWMQKLDVNGNLIHSSFSSNDPNAAALTPQRIQETRKDSRRSQRELPSEYFDQQSEEEYYPNYSVSQISNFPTGLPVYQTRSHERIAPRIAENQPRNPYHSNMVPLPSSQPYFEEDDYVDPYMQPHYGTPNENSHVSHSYGYSNPRIASGIGRSSSSQGSSPQSQSPAPKNTLGQNATSYGDEAYNYQSLHEPTYSCYPHMYQA